MTFGAVAVGQDVVAHSLLYQQLIRDMIACIIN